MSNNRAQKYSGALFAAVCIAACGGDSPGPIDPDDTTPVVSVRMSVTQASVVVQGTTQLMATALDASGNTLPGRQVSWGSSPPSVATVTQSGLVTGVTPGTATVEATIEGKKGQTTVTVTAVAGPDVTSRTGTVILPAGAALTLSTLHVQNSFGETSISATGTFVIDAFTAGAHPALVVSQAGNPVLLGWLDAQRTTLSARSTAEVLAFFDMGAHLMPVPARMLVMQELATKPELNALAAAITTAISSTPSTASLDVPAVHAARQSLQAQLLASSHADRYSGSGTARFSMLFDPLATKSGIAPFEVDHNFLAIRNQYRRRVLALVDRVSYTDANGVIHGAPQRVARQEIEPVFGVTTFTGLLTDVVVGNLAWAEVQSDPIATPLFPTDAKATSYRLLVLGTGEASAGERAQLTAADQQELRGVIGKALFADLVLPIMANLILSGDVAGDRIEAVLNAPGVANALSDAIGLLFQTAPTAIDKVYAGDMRGALEGVWIALGSSDTFQEKTFEVIAAITFALSPSSSLNLAEISEFGKNVLKFVGRVDMVMTASDACLQAFHSGLSNGVERWDLTVLPTKVSIDPPASVIGVSDVQLLRAVAHGFENPGSGVTLQYRWTTTGQHGKLYDANHPGGATQISGPFGETVSYGPGVQSSGIDNITLEIVRFEAGSQPVTIGTAAATVEVRPFAIAISPQDATLEKDAKQTFTVQVPQELANGAALRYRWSTTGDFGSFDRGVLSFENSQSQAAYTARSASRGEDQVIVEVLATLNGITTSLGRDRALVRIERAPFTVEPGSLSTRTDTLVHFMARPHGDLPAQPRYVWRFGDNSNPVTVNGDSIAGHTFTVPGQYEVIAELLDAGSGLRLATAKSAVVAGNIFYITHSPSDAREDAPVTLVARNRNARTPAQLRYEWSFGDGATGNVQGDSVVQHTWASGGQYSVQVVVKNVGGAELGRAILQLTVGTAEDVPVWRITSMQRMSVTGDVPDESMSQNPNLLTYGQYFRTRAVLDQVIAGQKPAYVHALDGATAVADCLDFDFDMDRNESFAWPPWIWIQFPQDVPTVCGENDNVLGHYPGDEAFSIHGPSLVFGFDYIAFINRFQNAGANPAWDYPAPALATVTRGEGTGALLGRHFPTASFELAPTPNRAYVVHEITAQISGAALTGQLRLIYRAFGGDTGDDVVAAWTATYNFTARQGR